MKVEEAFRVELDEEEVLDCETPSDLFDLIGSAKSN